MSLFCHTHLQTDKTSAVLSVLDAKILTLTGLFHYFRQCIITSSLCNSVLTTSVSHLDILSDAKKNRKAIRVVLKFMEKPVFSVTAKDKTILEKRQS